MGSYQPEEIILPLTLFDQIGIRNYARKYFLFPFPNPDHRPAAVTQLHDSLNLTLQEYPFLAGTVGLVDVIDPGHTLPRSERKGRLAMKYTPNVPADLQASGHLSVKYLTKEQFPHSYLELEQKGMPHKDFKTTTMSDIPVLLDEKAEHLLLRQVIMFFDGGLILNTNAYHAVIYAIPETKIVTTWVKWSRVLRATMVAGGSMKDLKKPEPKEPTGREDWLMDFKGPTDVHTLLQRCPELMLRPTQFPIPAMDAMGIHSVSSRILTVSTATVQQLKVRLNDHHDEVEPRNGVRYPLSSFACLAALLWHHVTLLRYRAGRLLPDELSYFACPINLVSRGIIPKDFFPGASSPVITVSLPVREVIESHPISKEGDQGYTANDTLIKLAITITKAIKQVDRSWFETRLQLIKSVDDVRDILPAILPRLGHSGIALNSWALFERTDIGLEAFDLQLIGVESADGREGGHPTCMRTPYHPIEGHFINLPGLGKNEGEGGVSQLVASLRGEDIKAFCGEDGFGDMIDKVVE